MDLPVLRAVAAGGGHPLIDLDFTIFIQFALFLILWFVATKMLFKPYLKMREDRTAGIDGAREEAVKMGEEADARMADYEDRLAKARDRALDEQRKIRAEATAHQREVTDKAREQALSAMEQSFVAVREQTDAARADLMPRADELARDIASRLLGREVA